MSKQAGHNRRATGVVNDTTRLLGLDGLAVVGVEDGPAGLVVQVVTADEAPDPRRLGLRLTVNGVVKQEGNTGDMIHPVDGIIEWSSKGMTLLPGALIATGTPDGVGFTRTPPEYLRPGDVMETEVEGIGVMRNRIVKV